MNKEKVFKIIALVLNLFVLISGQIIIWRILVIGYGTPSKYGALHYEFLEYFTNLSNLYTSIVAGLLAVFSIIHFKDDEYELPRWLSLMHLSAACSLALTASTVLFFLGPVNGFDLMYKEDMAFYHLINPIAIVASYFLMRHPKYYFRCTFWGIVPMALYGIFYSTFVLTGVWEDFYGFTFGGKPWAIFVVLPIMLCVTYLISFLLSIKNLRKQK